jgi:hypothetical protein
MIDRIGFTRQQAKGALPNGTRVQKIASGPGDAHKDGEWATVLGSLVAEEFDGRKNAYGYFVAWDDHPELPVFCTGWRLTKEEK